jgi:predicted secreted protein
MAQVEINEAQNDATVSVHVGDRVVLRLPERATSGYTWMLGDLPDGVQLIDDRYESPAGALPGGTSTRTLVFVATAAGRHRLRLVNRRPWEGEANEADSFTFEIDASGE